VPGDDARLGAKGGQVHFQPSQQKEGHCRMSKTRPYSSKIWLCKVEVRKGICDKG
jgi:hypothetical protein